MSTLYDSYTSDNNAGQFYGVNWRGQTYEATDDYDITSVKLKMSRGGSPGIVTVSIRNTSANLPTGADLASGTTDGDTLVTGLGGEWREITLDSPVSVSNGTKYAVVVRAISGDSSNYIWMRNDTANGYPDGQSCSSGNSGSSWSSGPTSDFVFEIWGDPSGEPPVITDQSTDTDASFGDNVTFSVTVTGDEPITYQWYKDGSPISGEVSSSISLTSVDANDGGTYCCTATNAAGSDTSDNIELRIIPYIVSQTNSTGVVRGSQFDLTITGDGSPSPTYQWYKNDVLLSGETSSTLTKFWTDSDAGTYKCTLTNGAGSVTSSNIVITIVDAIYITRLFNLPYDMGREG